MYRGVTFMQGAALAISSLSVVTKEALYHYTLRVGEGSNSDSVSFVLIAL
jgi:type IV secretory pathway VirB9-like protein